MDSPGSSDGKASAYNAGDPGSIPGQGDLLEKEIATHSSILACKIPWMEEPGRLQSMAKVHGVHRKESDVTDFTFTYFTKATSSSSLISVPMSNERIRKC